MSVMGHASFMSCGRIETMDRRLRAIRFMMLILRSLQAHAHAVQGCHEFVADGRASNVLFGVRVGVRCWRCDVGGSKVQRNQAA